ncbi:MAG: hypothetical protein KF878_17495 [Planctomycetes bacterium]|nr:hypothetical protein [Planctomycetota bacterium]
MPTSPPSSPQDVAPAVGDLLATLPLAAGLALSAVGRIGLVAGLLAATRSRPGPSCR